MPTPNPNAPENFPLPRYIPVREAIQHYLEARFGSDAVTEFSDYLAKAWKSARRYDVIRGTAGTIGTLAAVCVGFAIVDPHIGVSGEFPAAAVMAASFGSWLHCGQKRVQPPLPPRLAALMDLIGSDELPLFLKPHFPRVGQSMQRIDRSYLDAELGVLLWSGERSAYNYLRHRQKFSIAGDILVERATLETLVSAYHAAQDAGAESREEVPADHAYSGNSSVQVPRMHLNPVGNWSSGARDRHADPRTLTTMKIYRRAQELDQEGLAPAAIDHKLMDEFGCSKSRAEKIRNGKYESLKNALLSDDAGGPLTAG